MLWCKKKKVLFLFFSFLLTGEHQLEMLSFAIDRLRVTLSLLVHTHRTPMRFKVVQFLTHIGSGQENIKVIISCSGIEYFQLSVKSNSGLLGCRTKLLDWRGELSPPSQTIR